MFYSIKNPDRIVNWHNAILEGLSPDGSLYLPLEIPTVAQGEYKRLSSLSFPDLAEDILWRWLEKERKADVSRDEFKSLVHDVFNFPVELVEQGGFCVLELFHGPSLSFKDFGARFLARALDASLEKEGKDAVLITATSGDTGGAVAKAFAGSKRVKTYVLYPAGKISNLQEKQITTVGGMVDAIALEGDFDACQSLVKRALADKEFKDILLTSANSINVGRLLPQTLYYIYTYLKISDLSEQMLFSIPCGNYGNITAGILAQKMGFPFKFVSACNENAMAPAYLKSGVFEPKPTIHTFSSAMDIGNPSNFARVLTLYNNDRDEVAKNITATETSDKETLETMSRVYKDNKYILDPHGAVSWNGLEQCEEDKITKKVVLETAHPAKFPETVKEAIGIEAEIPRILKDDLAKEGHSKKILNSYEEFKRVIMNSLSPGGRG